MFRKDRKSGGECLETKREWSSDAKIIVTVLTIFVSIVAVALFVEFYAPKVRWPASGVGTLIPALEEPRGEVVQMTEQVFEVNLENLKAEEYFFYAMELERDFQNELPMEVYAQYVPELAHWNALGEMTDYAYQLFLQGEKERGSWMMLSTYGCTFRDKPALSELEVDKEELRERGIKMVDERFQGYDAAGNRLSFSRVENRLSIKVESAEKVAKSMVGYIPPAPEIIEEPGDRAEQIQKQQDDYDAMVTWILEESEEALFPEDSS